MRLTMPMFLLLLALTQNYGTTAFRGTDFTSVFKGSSFTPDGTSAFRGTDFTSVFKRPNLTPDDLPSSNVKNWGLGKRLSDIEERFNSVTNLESRLDDMEQRLEASKTNDTDAKEVKTKMAKMDEQLHTVQDTLTSLSAVANTVEQIQATVAASSDKNEQDKKSLVETLATTRGRVSGIEAEIQEMKTKLNGVEGNFQKLKTELNSGDRTSGLRDARCPSDYEYDGTTKLCLKLVKAPSLGSNAKSNCLTQADDGRLAQLDTPKKHEFAKTYFRHQGQNADVYIGGIRNLSGKYTWLDGREIRNANWCVGEPRGTGCVSLWHDKGFCLDDSPCSRRMAYLCEVPLDE